jgi:predicted nucleic acid-binding protein
MAALGRDVAVWDTTVLSREQPEGDVAEYVLARATIGEPVHAAAPAVLEVAYGYQLKAGEDPRYGRLLAWFADLVARGSLNVVPLDGRAAIVAGQMRARSPHAPRRRRDDRRSKTMRQASWLIDIEIAATAFAAGLDVATDNRGDFEALGDLLADLYPDAPRLVAQGPPV